MNYTPAGPYFEHMRDGMLQAVAGDVARQCAIWRGFADSGIGQGASARVRGSRVTINESNTVPSACP